jgi:RNA polymerase sigma-70 factor (ECF subfamily)
MPSLFQERRDVKDPEDLPGGPRAAGSGPSDHELLRRAQRGDERAFEELVRRHEGRTLRVAWSWVGSREDARDLAQEAFLRVFRNLERFDFGHEFTTWLYKIITNLAIDHLRKRRPQRSTTVEREEGDYDMEVPDEDTEPPWRALDQSETGAKVRACIDRLAPHFRNVMILREIEGLPCTEIAEIVGATHVTVRWRLHRGRKLFQEEWERMERAAGREPGPPTEQSEPDGPNNPSEVPV